MSGNVYLCLLIIFLSTFPLSIYGNQKDILRRVDARCKSPVVRTRVRQVLVQLEKQGLLSDRVVNLLNRGLLKGVPCERLALAVEQELKRQQRGKALMKRYQLDDTRTLRLVVQALGFGLAVRSVARLLQEHVRMRQPLLLAQAVDFLSSMGRLGFEEKEILPLAEVIISRGLNTNRISSMKQLLLWGRTIKLKVGQSVRILRIGMEQDRSVRSIRQEMREKRPF